MRPTVDTEARFGAQRRQTFFVKTRGPRGNVSTFTFNSLLHRYCTKTKQDCCDRRKSDTVLQFDRAGSKILYAVDHIFHLLCAFNYLQPTKKFLFSVVSRATGSLQITPSGSGDENGSLQGRSFPKEIEAWPGQKLFSLQIEN